MYTICKGELQASYVMHGFYGRRWIFILWLDVKWINSGKKYQVF